MKVTKLKRQGFLVKMRTHGGRKVINNRRKTGRKELTRS